MWIDLGQIIKQSVLLLKYKILHFFASWSVSEIWTCLFPNVSFEGFFYSKRDFCYSDNDRLEVAKEEPKRLSREQMFIMISAASLNFSSMVCYSILGPFFPREVNGCMCLKQKSAVRFFNDSLCNIAVHITKTHLLLYQFVVHKMQKTYIL